MRKLNILKALVDFLFFITIIPSIFGMPLILMLLIMPEQVPVTYNDKSMGLESLSLAEVVVIVFAIYVGYLFQVYAVYLFRKTLELFRKRIIFDERVIKYLDQTGKAILIGHTIMLIPIIYLYYLTDKPGFRFEWNFTFNGSIFIFGLGLFFMVLSEVFLIATNMKRENDLTV